MNEPGSYAAENLKNGEKGRFLFVIENRGKICGFVSGGPHRQKIDKYTGEIYALYIDKNNQGVKMGTKLFQAGIEALIKIGMPNVAIWVLNENTAYQFYEKMGGRYFGKKSIIIGSKEYIERGYVWDN